MCFASAHHLPRQTCQLSAAMSLVAVTFLNQRKKTCFSTFSETAVKQKMAASSHRCTSSTNTIQAASNSSGFGSLPRELYLEILSHIPPVPIQTIGRVKKYGVGQDYRPTMDSLGRSCRSLRQFFVKYLWRRIEVYDGMKLHDGQSQSDTITSEEVRAMQMTNELSRQLEVVRNISPEFAHYVQ